MKQATRSILGVEGDDRLQHCRQVFGLAQHAAPLVQLRILVPVEIIDESTSFTGASSPGPLCLFDLGFRSREQRIDGTEIDTGEVDAIIIVAPLPLWLNHLYRLDPASFAALPHWQLLSRQ